MDGTTAANVLNNKTTKKEMAWLIYSTYYVCGIQIKGPNSIVPVSESPHYAHDLIQKTVCIFVWYALLLL